MIHGDIKPQNVIIFKSEDGSFVPKVADFGYSTLMSEPDVTISLPQSHPWFAPEILEYPNFAPAQASLTDIFSYGMLCLWFIFEKSLSDVESSLTPAENTAGVRAMPDISDISVHKLSDMRRNNSSLIELSAHIISADRNLDAETKIRLRDFSHATLSYDPRERQPSLPRLLNFLGSIDDLIPEQVGSFGFNPPQASDFKVRSDTP